MKTHVLEYLELGSLKTCADAAAIDFRDQSLSFAQLNHLATHFAAAICRSSSAVNSPVCVYLPRGIETVAANLGTLGSRNCYSNLDVRSPLARTAAILNNLTPSLIITSKELEPTPSFDCQFQRSTTVGGRLHQYPAHPSRAR
jgi:acyl-CoA synthetase (AMP-forming)/AMP-acid ligase II